MLNEYIQLKILAYQNIQIYLNMYNVKIKKKLTNECPNIGVALKSNEYLTNEYIRQ